MAPLDPKYMNLYTGIRTVIIIYYFCYETFVVKPQRRRPLGEIVEDAEENKANPREKYCEVVNWI
jgi:hypothetical protein